MSNHASHACAPSLLRVMKQLAREWRSVRESGYNANGGTDWGKRYFALPIWTLVRLIEESISFPAADIEWAAWYSDRMLERTPPKHPSDAFIPPENHPDLGGLPEDYATGAILNHLRSIREAMRTCDEDGRTATILAELEAKHLGVLGAFGFSGQLVEKKQAAPRRPGNDPGSSEASAKAGGGTKAKGRNGKRERLPALNETASAALSIIRAKKGDGLGAKEIVVALGKKGITIQEVSFRRHIVPLLKCHGVKNHRARGGYYLP